MKRNIVIKVIVCILLTVLMIRTSPYAFAHSSSQAGILAKTYHSVYEQYYIGGEDVGWSIDESCHTNGTSLTYSFSSSDADLSSTYQSYVTTGANRWRETITITNKTDGTGVGIIETYSNPNTGIVAVFHVCASNSSGHLTSWKIRMNRARNVTATTLAHEFGHAIGLNDLYDDQNINKLMYGYESRTVSRPTASDKWGAKVITGVHTSHTWAYKYHSTTSTGDNRHVGYCTACNGVSATISACVYNSDNICTYCNIPRGIQPWSIDHEYEAE